MQSLPTGDRCSFSGRCLLLSTETRSVDMQIKTILSLLGACALLNGCKNSDSGPNPVAMFYKPAVGATGSTSKSVQTQYAYVGSMAEGRAMEATYIRSGYHIIGES